jgi:ABC-type dipeptide/oligopeptide/nickel transport system permease component
MLTFILRRLLFALFVLIAVTLLSFILVYLAGDPARSLAGIDANEERLSQIREAYGLEQPILTQYLIFVGNALQGELGWSFRYRTPVLPLVAEKFVATLQLAIISLLFSLGVAIPLGVFAALWRNTLFDSLSLLLSLVGVSTPGFWLGIILILIFSDALRLLPPSGREGLQSFVLPGLTLSGYGIGMLTRLLRRAVIEEMREGYVATARAKGLAEHLVQLRHILRNALIPTVTVAGLQFGAMLGGTIVVETVFAWPGVGSLMLQALQSSDLPIIRAVVLVIGASFVLINLSVDVLYVYLDPRIRYQ